MAGRHIEQMAQHKYDEMKKENDTLQVEYEDYNNNVISFTRSSLCIAEKSSINSSTVGL